MQLIWALVKVQQIYAGLFDNYFYKIVDNTEFHVVRLSFGSVAMAYYLNV